MINQNKAADVFVLFYLFVVVVFLFVFFKEADSVDIFPPTRPFFYPLNAIADQ